MTRSHYDNLQVSRDASDLVIRAAYKSLVQKYHPDKFTGATDEAERIMKILNEAYAVLTDPVLRRQHDEWLNRQSEPSVPSHPDVPQNASSTTEAHASTRQSAKISRRKKAHWCLFAAFLSLGLFFIGEPTSRSTDAKLLAGLSVLLFIPFLSAAILFYLESLLMPTDNNSRIKRRAGKTSSQPAND